MVSSETNYTIDELLNKTPEWLGLVYDKTMQCLATKNGVDYKKEKVKLDENKIINSKKVLGKIGLKLTKGKK